MTAAKLSVATLVIICFLWAATGYSQEAATILTGKVITTVSRAVPMPFNAVVDEVLVKPGDKVSDGSPLIRYTLQEDAGRLLQREMNMGAGTEDLKSQVFAMQRELAALTADYNKTKHLVASGLGSRQALNRVEDSVSLLKSRIELAREMIHKNENNFKARLKELSGYYGEQIREGSTLPDVLTLTSPISGYVLSVAPALNKGQLLMAGATPVQVGQLNPVLIQVPVYEAEINSIHVGETAEVEIPSLNNRKFEGIVNEISWISSDMNVANPSYYTVTLTVPNPDLLLKPGFKSIVRFTLKPDRR